MTRKFLSLISGLLIMFLSISSLYAQDNVLDYVILLNETSKAKLNGILTDYNVKKDAFGSFSMVKSKKFFMNGEYMMRGLQANGIFAELQASILESNGNTGLAYGINFYQLSKESTVYIKGLVFSDGDNFVEIDAGLANMGQVSYTTGGTLIRNEITVARKEALALYNLLKNSGDKTILVRIRADVYTYDSKIGNREKSLMLDLLSIYERIK